MVTFVSLNTIIVISVNETSTVTNIAITTTIKLKTKPNAPFVSIAVSQSTLVAPATAGLFLSFQSNFSPYQVPTAFLFTPSTPADSRLNHVI